MLFNVVVTIDNDRIGKFKGQVRRQPGVISHKFDEITKEMTVS